MHPILRDTSRLALYVGAWLLVGALVALVVAGPGLESWKEALLLCLPLADVFGFICLAVWYSCRATPIAGSSIGRLLAVHGSGAVVSTTVWLALGWGWSQILDTTGLTARSWAVFRGNLVLFAAVGVLFYVLAVALHYLLLAFDASRRAESEALEAKLLARQAELDAFKAQIDPHFLFNCLNSISSLCGRDPQAARRTTTRLGEFLRSSLALGSRDTISLADELALARAYLDVEKARFGDRLVLEEEIDEATLTIPVPALLLQPLLENALKHGVAHLLEPGRVALGSRATSTRLTLSVRNSCDPDRPVRDGMGIGLENVRGRLRLLYGREATMSVGDHGNSFEVEVVLPRDAQASTGPDQSRGAS